MADERKITLKVNSWVNKCEEQEVYDSVSDADIRFFNMFEIPTFENFEAESDFVVEGKVRLDVLAKRFYGDELLWWIIAARNNMDLPDAELYEGQVLKIPARDYVLSTILRK